MNIDAFISQLEKARRVGSGRWMARCPAHPDRTPSLSIRAWEHGGVSVHCFGQQCSSDSIFQAVGLRKDDFLPSRRPRPEGYKGHPRPAFPSDVYNVARHELCVIRLIATDMVNDRTISPSDFARLKVAVDRIEHIAEAAYGSR